MKQVLVLSFCLFVAQAAKNVFEYDMSAARQLLEKFTQRKQMVYEGRRLTAFQWKDCSTSSSLVAIKALSISPDPLAFPGPLDITTNFIIKKDLVSPMKGDVKLYRKTLGTFIEIPCIDGFGSCSYDDVCQLLSPIQSQCPDPVKKIGIDCACPVKANSYSLPKTEFPVAASIIPAGEYHVIANVTYSGADVACLDVYLNVE